MGWTYTYKERGISVKDFFAHEFDYQKSDEEGGKYGKVVDCSASLSEAYLAYEIGDHNGKQRVIAIVCLMHHAPKSAYNLGYKDMDESMGPYNYNCPKRILDLLTPTEYEQAREWRQKK